MEQKKNMMMISSSGGDYHHNNKSDEDENGQMGYLPIHSQVMKIKKEFEKIKHPSLALQQPDMRRVLHGINRQRRSRSPLGLPDQRTISVGVERNSCRA